MKFTRPLIKAIMIAPLNIMGVIPFTLYWISSGWSVLQPYNLKYSPVSAIAGLALIACGFYLVCRSVSDLTAKGEDGTPAPWHPPANLVVTGVYRRTRNPMVSGVAIVLLGETILSGAILVCGWFLFWIVSNLTATPLMEEPELEARFGKDFLNYKISVPRWLPAFGSPLKKSAL